MDLVRVGAPVRGCPLGHAFMLERGIAVRQGIGFLRTEPPSILATRTGALSPRLLCVIEELAGDWRRLDQRAYPARSKHWPVKIRHVRA